MIMVTEAKLELVGTKYLKSQINYVIYVLDGCSKYLKILRR